MMDASLLPQALEAVLFVAGDPVSFADLAAALEVSEMELQAALEKLESAQENRGVIVRRYGDKLRMETRPEFADAVHRLMTPAQKQSLSQTVMETLAVIAYRQPVTRGDIEAVRGVKCDYSVQSLLQKGLIREAGRRETLGRPTLYATTDAFLRHFGLTDLRELPPLPEDAPPPPEEPLTP